MVQWHDRFAGLATAPVPLELNGRQLAQLVEVVQSREREAKELNMRHRSGESGYEF
jgi:hypothetical protein